MDSRTFQKKYLNESNETAKIFKKKRALKALEQKNKLQMNADVMSTQISKLEDVQLVLDTANTNNGVLEAMKSVTDILEDVNKNNENMEDDLDDFFEKFNELNAEVSLISEKLREDDEDDYANFRQELDDLDTSDLGVRAPTPPQPQQQTHVEMPIAPDRTVHVPPPQSIRVAKPQMM